MHSTQYEAPWSTVEDDRYVIRIMRALIKHIMYVRNTASQYLHV